jgi:hypothetical protein
LDPFVDDPISCTILLPSSNSNGNQSTDSGLLTSTCNFDGLNISKKAYGSTPSIYSPIGYRPFCVCFRCCCKCCYKCWKCCGFAMVSIQSSYTSPSKCRCSSFLGNLVSCTLLTSLLNSFNCFSYGDVICGTSYCEVTFYPSILGSMRWLYSEVHMLLVKEKMQSVYLDIKLHL